MPWRRPISSSESTAATTAPPTRGASALPSAGQSTRVLRHKPRPQGSSYRCRRQRAYGWCWVARVICQVHRPLRGAAARQQPPPRRRMRIPAQGERLPPAPPGSPAANMQEGLNTKTAPRRIKECARGRHQGRRIYFSGNVTTTPARMAIHSSRLGRGCEQIHASQQLLRNPAHCQIPNVGIEAYMPSHAPCCVHL